MCRQLLELLLLLLCGSLCDTGLHEHLRGCLAGKIRLAHLALEVCHFLGERYAALLRGLFTAASLCQLLLRLPPGFLRSSQWPQPQ